MSANMNDNISPTILFSKLKLCTLLLTDKNDLKMEIWFSVIWFHCFHSGKKKELDDLLDHLWSAYPPRQRQKGMEKHMTSQAAQHMVTSLACALSYSLRHQAAQCMLTCHSWYDVSFYDASTSTEHADLFLTVQGLPWCKKKYNEFWHVMAGTMSSPVARQVSQHMLMCLWLYRVSSYNVSSSVAHAKLSLTVQGLILWFTKQHST